MKTLIVEDDFISRVILQEYLSPFGTCDIATTGNEATWAFGYALRQDDPYELVCLDIMLPVKDGFHVLEHIRAMERKRGINGYDCTKVVMTSSLHGAKEIIRAFKSQCEGYLIKPLNRKQFIHKLVDLGLVKPTRLPKEVTGDSRNEQNFIEKGAY